MELHFRTLFFDNFKYLIDADAVPSDQALVQLFPYAFAAAFRMAALEERSTYNAAIDACENNMHCMAASVVAFIRYGNIASTNGDETVAKEVMNEFMRVRPHPFINDRLPRPCCCARVRKRINRNASSPW